MFEIGKYADVYCKDEAGKKLSENLLRILSDEKNVEVIRSIVPVVHSLPDDACCNRSAMELNKFMDKDSMKLLYDDAMAQKVFEAAEKMRDNTNPHSLAGAVLQAASSAALEKKVRNSGNYAAWEKFKSIASSLADTIDRSEDCLLKEHLAPRLELYDKEQVVR